MANKNLFGGKKVIVPVVDIVNAAGGAAYSRTPRSTLAQVAATNCFNGTYYADAETNLKLAKDAVVALKNDPLFIAKTALYCREKAHMKDMPAFLMVCLASLDTKLFRKLFPKIINNGKMLRNFVQIARSGQTGRVFNLSAGTCRHAIREWFKSHGSDLIFKASIGNDPTLKDILCMARPLPETEEKATLYAYLKGAEFNEETKTFRTYNKDKSVKYEHKFDNLPPIVKEYELYKKNKEGKVPDVDFRMLDSLGLSQENWTEVAKNASWTITRMNLNTFARHGVFENKEVAKLVAKRLANKEEILAAKAYPYQLMMAYMATESNNVPQNVREALQDAMEVAIENVPEFGGNVHVAIDVSGSMSSSITGSRTGATSKVRCVDVASLFASAILRKNKAANLMPFDAKVYSASLNPRDTVLTNSQKLAKYGGGSTNCALVLETLCTNNVPGDLVIYISDSESWVDSSGYFGNGTGMLAAWKIYKKKNPAAKLVCIDLTPKSNSQVKEHKDILQVGGFGDQVFDVIKSFVEQSDDVDHWTKVIDNIEIK